MRDPARMYRESAVRGASPVGLIVILYDEIVRSLRKAQYAQMQRQVEGRTQALNHVVEVIGYLQSILDFEKGGDVARSLSLLYDLTRAKILGINLQPSEEAIDALAREFVRMSAAWRQAEQALMQPAAAHPLGELVAAGVRESVMALER